MFVTSWGGSDYNNSGDRHRVLSHSIHGAKLVLLWKWKTGGYDCAAATFVVLDYFEAFTTIGALDSWFFETIHVLWQIRACYGHQCWLLRKENKTLAISDVR